MSDFVARSGQRLVPITQAGTLKRHRSNSFLMKPILFLTLTLLTVVVALTAFAAPAKKTKLRHVVAFKFRDSAKPEDIRKVEDAFAALKGKIPQIQGYEAGTNNSPEGLNKGCTHAFVLTFASEKDRDAYLVHPDHKEFGKLLGPYLADVFVIDFWARD
jgi:hypothetical protein